jgi:(p)ppGpp synthase/HD superfamily hydrolase
MIIEALDLAFSAHKDQKRKISGAPYIVHILDVMNFLIEENADEEVVVAGILHDILEDTAVPATVIKEKFGERVLALVQFCSEEGITKDTPNTVLKKTWQERKQESLKKTRKGSDEEVLLKLADKLANLSSLYDDILIYGDKVWSYFHSGKEEQEKLYRAMGLIFKKKFPKSRLVILYEQRLKEVFG